MSFYRTDDPAADFDRLDRQQSKWLASLPVCGNCGKPIQDEHYYLISGENICPDCMDNDFRVENDALEQ